MAECVRSTDPMLKVDWVEKARTQIAAFAARFLEDSLEADYA